MYNSIGNIFNNTFNNAEVEGIEFNPSWKNGTGYFDNAVYVDLQPGEMRKCRDDQGRRLILIGTRFKTIVVFDRFKNQEDDGVYVTNFKKNVLLGTLLSGNSVGEQEMITLMGSWGNLKHNIGRKIEQIAELFGA